MISFFFSAVIASALSASISLSVKTIQEPSAQTKQKIAPAEQKKSEAAPKPPDESEELQRAVEASGNDRAAMVRNLEQFLKRFPNSQYKPSVFRAIVESAVQVRDYAKALDYSERLIAIRPDDSGMMLLAVDLLERAGDSDSLTRAVGYATRVLDRAEKPDLSEKSDRMSIAEWEMEQKKLKMSVYLIRGRLEMTRRNYPQAAGDFEASYRALQNSTAALRLGEIAEIQKDNSRAIEKYAEAFALPDTFGSSADRKDIRRKLGNLWRVVHGSDAGLGDYILAAYDRIAAASAPRAAPRNSGASDPFAFVMRRPGFPDVKIADWKGKVIVVNFWATWCLPCREMEPLLEKVMQKYDGQSDVVFLAVNTDEDETLVPPYLKKEKIRSTVVYDDGLGHLLQIRAIPSVLVLDRSGKIAFRTDGFLPTGFVDNLTAVVETALHPKASP
ncbi:MAG: redoxin family protein [Acidobacteria bacterium]|nr:redoxin family protein [Acidobacteriota bacterium]